MSLSEKLAYIKNFVKLKQQQEIIEKGNQNFFDCMKINCEAWKNFREERNHSRRGRNKTIGQLQRQMSEYNLEFEKIKQIINQFRNGEMIDVEDCKTKMIALLEKLKNFDATDDCVILQNEQKDLEDFYYDFCVNLSKIKAQKHMGLMQKSSTSTGLPMRSMKNINTTYEGTYDEIEDFETLICKTGHTQTWKDEDHRLFINIRKKCRNIPEMVTEIQKKCPDITAEQIVYHEAWYKTYLKLREKQRLAVKEWRIKKEQARVEKIAAIKNSENKTGNVVSVAKCEIKNNELKMCTPENEALNIFELCSENVGQIKNQKELIKQWKICKEQTKLANEERIKRHEEAEYKRKHEIMVKKMMVDKVAIQNYKQEKMQKTLQLLLSKKSNKEIIFQSPEIMENFRKRDELFVKQRSKLLQLKNNKLMKSQWLNINNNCSKAKSRRLPEQSTLMKPTKIWIEKCKPELSSEKIPQPLLYIKDLPKLQRAEHLSKSMSLGNSILKQHANPRTNSSS